jgi:HEAT repeat protein
MMPPRPQRRWLKGLVGLIALAFFVWLLLQAPFVRQEVAADLGDAGPWAVPLLCRYVVDEDVKVRQSAIDSLVGIGPSVVPRIAADLNHSDSAIRIRAALVLSALGARGINLSPAIAPLTQRLEDANPEVRLTVVRALWSAGDEAGPALPRLAAALDDPDPGVRAQACEAMWRLHQTDPEVVRKLIERLGDEEPDVRAEAAEAIGHLPLNSAEVVTALQRALRDPDPQVRQEAAEAIQRIEVENLQSKR